MIGRNALPATTSSGQADSRCLLSGGGDGRGAVMRSASEPPRRGARSAQLVRGGLPRRSTCFTQIWAAASARRFPPCRRSGKKLTKRGRLPWRVVCQPRRTNQPWVARWSMREIPKRGETGSRRGVMVRVAVRGRRVERRAEVVAIGFRRGQGKSLRTRSGPPGRGSRPRPDRPGGRVSRRQRRSTRGRANGMKRLPSIPDAEASPLSDRSHRDRAAPPRRGRSGRTGSETPATRPGCRSSPGREWPE